jgi:DNA-binding protein HU-beta
MKMRDDGEKRVIRGGNTMNKTELVAAMAKETELSKKDVEAVLKSFVDVVTAELKKGGRIQLVGFGTFEVSERAEREGRNPQTGETMKISASKAPKFKAGKALKDAINE